MQLHNPLRVSRLCVSLGEQIEAHETRDIPDRFTCCAGCACVITDKPVEKRAAAGKASA